MNHRIYISKSNLADQETLKELRGLLKKEGVTIEEYSGGKYSDEPIQKSSLFMSVSYPEAKEKEKVYLGKGTFTEALKASILGIPVYYFDGRFFRCKEVSTYDQNDYQKKFGYMVLYSKPENLRDILKKFPIKEHKLKNNIELI